MEQLLALILEEQRKTNGLLFSLIEAMSDEQEQEYEPVRHLDGSPV